MPFVVTSMVSGFEIPNARETPGVLVAKLQRVIFRDPSTPE